MQAFGKKKYIFYIKTGNYIHVDTKTKNNKNYLLKNNLNNFRANQLPGATRKTTHSVNWYINP